MTSIWYPTECKFMIYPVVTGCRIQHDKDSTFELDLMSERWGIFQQFCGEKWPRDMERALSSVSGLGTKSTDKLCCCFCRMCSFSVLSPGLMVHKEGWENQMLFHCWRQDRIRHCDRLQSRILQRTVTNIPSMPSKCSVYHPWLCWFHIQYVGCNISGARC